MAGVFVNYRRADSADAAHLLADGLQRRFGARQVFIDVDDIAVGADWAEVIQQQLGEVSALIAVIGPQWLTVTDHGGEPRIWNDTDTVRSEISSALSAGITVVPVLVEGASMPRADQLPPDIRELTRYNALVASEDIRSDTARLAEAIEDELTVRTVPARAGGALLYGWTFWWAFIAFGLVSSLTTDCWEEGAGPPVGPRVVVIAVYLVAYLVIIGLRRQIRARRGGRRVATTASLYLVGPLAFLASLFLGLSVDE